MDIALTVHNRFFLLVKSLNSLFRTNFQARTRLFIFDDCSGDKKTIAFLEQVRNKKVQNLEIRIKKRKEQLGCDKNMVTSIHEVFGHSQDKFIVSIDSDAIYNPFWLRVLTDAIQTVKPEDKVGAISVFNVENHPVVREYNRVLNEKASIGGFASLINREAFMSPELETQSWDWSFCRLCSQHGYKLLCTKKSYVQHIGRHGVHSSGTTIPDFAKDFEGEE